MESGILVKVVLPLSLFIIMLGMGLSLLPADFARIIKRPKAVITGIVCQMVLLPVLGWVVVRTFQLEPTIAVGLMVIAFCPAGTTSNMYSFLFRGDLALSITLTAIVSVLAPFTIPFLTHWSMVELMGQGAALSLPVGSTIVQLLVITALPVGLGMWLRHWKPNGARKADKPLRYLSVFFLFLVIVGIMIQNRAEMLGFFLETGAATLTLNVLAMIAGLFISLGMRLSRPQSITISFEVGIQNGTMALLITGTMLGVARMTIAPVTYSLLMFATAALFGVLINLLHNAKQARAAQNAPEALSANKA